MMESPRNISVLKLPFTHFISNFFNCITSSENLLTISERNMIFMNLNDPNEKFNEIMIENIQHIEYSNKGDIFGIFIKNTNFKNKLVIPTWFYLDPFHLDIMQTLENNFKWCKDKNIIMMNDFKYNKVLKEFNKMHIKNGSIIRKKSNMISNHSDISVPQQLNGIKMCPLLNLSSYESCKQSSKKSDTGLKRTLKIPKDVIQKKKKINLISDRKLLYAPSPTNSIEIIEDDLLCLLPETYLNDNIINLYLIYIYFEVLSQSQRDVTYFFNVFFNTKLIGTPSQQKLDTPVTRHTRVAKWTKNVDIFSKDFIVIPVIEDEHWFLVIVCFPWMAGMFDYNALRGDSIKSNIPVNNSLFATKDRRDKYEQYQTKQNLDPKPCILILDSLDSPNRSVKVNIIRDYLKSEWDSKRAAKDGPLIFDKTTCRGYSPKVLKQDNGTDCGLYLLLYVESFFKNPLTSYEVYVFSNGFLNWFPRQSVNDMRQTMIELIRRKTKEVLPVDENDDLTDIL